MKCVSACAAEDENTERTLGTQKGDTTQGFESLCQKILRDIGLKVQHLVFRENQRGALPQGAASETVVRADGLGRKQPFAHGEVFRLTGEEPGTGIVRFVAGVLVAQDAADAGRDLRKDLLQVPVRRHDTADVQQHLQPVHLLAQFSADIFERLFQPSLDSDLDDNGGDSRDCASAILDGKVVHDKVAGFGSGGKRAGNFEVDRLAGGKHTLKLGLNQIGEIPQDFPYCLAQMIGSGDAVDFCQTVVDGEIAEIGIHDAEANRGRTEIGRQQFLRLGERLRVRERNQIGRAGGDRIIRHGTEPPPEGLARRPHPTLTINWMELAVRVRRPLHGSARWAGSAERERRTWSRETRRRLHPRVHSGART